MTDFTQILDPRSPQQRCNNTKEMKMRCLWESYKVSLRFAMNLQNSIQNGSVRLAVSPKFKKLQNRLLSSAKWVLECLMNTLNWTMSKEVTSSSTLLVKLSKQLKSRETVRRLNRARAILRGEKLEGHSQSSRKKEGESMWLPLCSRADTHSQSIAKQVT